MRKMSPVWGSHFFLTKCCIYKCRIPIWPDNPSCSFQNKNSFVFQFSLCVCVNAWEKSQPMNSLFFYVIILLTKWIICPYNSSSCFQNNIFISILHLCIIWDNHNTLLFDNFGKKWNKTTLWPRLFQVGVGLLKCLSLLGRQIDGGCCSHKTKSVFWSY